VGARVVHFDRYARSSDASDESAPIALVVASGDIMPGRSASSPWSGDRLGAETLIAQLRDLRERGSVRAVVLRIDSPGGDGGASDDIWREVRRLRSVKPVIVSMSDVAASGGYYIACAADSIVAQPATLTGSIGVFGGKLNMLGLYNKLGLNVETVARGRHAEMMSPFRDFTPEEGDRFRARLAHFYRTFLSRVATGRSMEPERVDSVGQGRVWSGVAARERGLVDALGGMDLALRIAARRAGLDESAISSVRMVPHGRGNAFGRFLAGLVEEEQEADLRVLFERPEWRVLARLGQFTDGAVLARLPFELRYE
jgi:protease-4